MNQAKSGLIVTLIIVAGVVGYLVYQSLLSPEQQVGMVSTSPTPRITPRTTPTTTTTTTPQPTSVGQTPSPSPMGFSSLSEDEKTILQSPSDLKLAQRLAKESAVIEFTKCSPNPVVLKIKAGSPIMIKNQDSTEYAISFDANKGRGDKLKAQQTTQISGDFTKEGGIFGYRCDSSSRLVGIVFAEK